MLSRVTVKKGLHEGNLSQTKQIIVSQITARGLSQTYPNISYLQK
jgi:hypothetical protein